MKKMFKMVVKMESGKEHSFIMNNVHNMTDVRKQLKYFEDSMNVGQSASTLVTMKIGNKVVGYVKNNGVMRTKMVTMF